MQIKVLLFGPQAQLAGKSAVTLDLPDDDATASRVLATLGEYAAPLAPTLASSRLAINHAYAQPGDAVTEQDEIALIGMVSGG